jgi:hypothetical protein
MSIARTVIMSLQKHEIRIGDLVLAATRTRPRNRNVHRGTPDFGASRALTHQPGRYATPGEAQETRHGTIPAATDNRFRHERAVEPISDVFSSQFFSDC